MPSYVTPKINTEFIFYIQLEAAAGGSYQTNPTIAAGDFLVSTDGGSTSNLDTLPTVTPASGDGVKVTVSATEMNGDNIRIQWEDAAGGEWLPGYAVIQTTANQIDDLALSTEVAPALLQSTTIATLASQTSFTLTAGSADDDAYNGATIIITDVSTSAQKAVGLISDYTGSTKTVTLAADPGIFTMATTDIVDIIAAPAQLPATALNDVAATDIVSAGAITTSSGAVSNVTLVATTTTNTDMRGTDSAATAANLATVDANVDAILVDTAEIGVAGAGLTALATQASVNTIDGIVDAILVDTNELQGDWTNGGRLDLIIDELTTNVDAIETDTQDIQTQIGAAGAGLTAVPWNSAWDAEVESEVTDGLTAFWTSPATLVDLVWDEALSGHQSAGTAGRNLTLAGTILAETTVTGVPTTTTCILASGSAVDDFYNDLEIIPLDGAVAGQARAITDYDGTSKTVTVDEAWTSAMSASDAVLIRATHKHSRTQLADSIWDEALSGHTTAGSAGKAIADIETDATAILADSNELQGDWTNGGRLDLILDELTTQGDTNETKIDTIDTNVDAIKTKTDSLTFTVANQVDANTLQIEGADATDGINAACDTAISDFWTTPATLVDLIWDEPLTGATHNVANSSGKRLRQVEAALVVSSGTAQAGAANTITLAAGESATDDIYTHDMIVITEGTGAGESALIVMYTGSSKVAKIAPSWVVTPDATSVYEIRPALAHSETGWATIKVGLAAAGAAGTITLDSDASSTDDYYNDDKIHIDRGTGEGQTRIITDYDGASKVATIHRNWDVTPDTTSEYIVEEGMVTTDHLSSEALALINTEVDTALSDYDAPTKAELDALIGTPAADVSADIAAVKAETALIVADTNELQTDDVPGLIAALNDISTADVNAQVLDVLVTDTHAEVGQETPAATQSFLKMVQYLYKAWRNKTEVTATAYKLYSDDTTTVDQKSTLSDDGTTFTDTEKTTGP